MCSSLSLSDSSLSFRIASESPGSNEATISVTIASAHRIRNHRLARSLTRTSGFPDRCRIRSRQGVPNPLRDFRGRFAATESLLAIEPYRANDVHDKSGRTASGDNPRLECCAEGISPGENCRLDQIAAVWRDAADTNYRHARPLCLVVILSEILKTPLECTFRTTLVRTQFAAGSLRRVKVFRKNVKMRASPSTSAGTRIAPGVNKRPRRCSRRAVRATEPSISVEQRGL